jgi:hypothetical protein
VDHADGVAVAIHRVRLFGKGGGIDHDVADRGQSPLGSAQQQGGGAGGDEHAVLVGDCEVAASVVTALSGQTLQRVDAVLTQEDLDLGLEAAALIPCELRVQLHPALQDLTPRIGKRSGHQLTTAALAATGNRVVDQASQDAQRTQQPRNSRH